MVMHAGIVFVLSDFEFGTPCWRFIILVLFFVISSFATLVHNLENLFSLSFFVTISPPINSGLYFSSLIARLVACRIGKEEKHSNHFNSKWF